MNNTANKSEGNALPKEVDVFVETIHFDMQFKDGRTDVDQTSVIPDTQGNCESETCVAIPNVGFMYIRVSKKDPRASRSGQARIDKIRKIVMRYASIPKSKTSVLRVIEETIITQLRPNKKSVITTQAYYLEDSYANCEADGTCSERDIIEMPPHLKNKRKGRKR